MKVKFNIKNVHVAIAKESTEGNITYEIPKHYPGCVSFTADPEGDKEKFYADGIPYYVSNANDGYSGELEMAYINEWFRMNVLGEKKSVEGLLTELSNAEGNKFALMYEIEGDSASEKCCFPYATAARPKQEDKSAEGKKTPQTGKISYDAQAIPGTNLVKWTTCEDTPNSVKDTFFDKVIIPKFEQE